MSPADEGDTVPSEWLKLADRSFHPTSEARRPVSLEGVRQTGRAAISTCSVIDVARRDQGQPGKLSKGSPPDGAPDVACRRERNVSAPPDYVRARWRCAG